MMKVLLFDVETAPCLAYMWSMWQELKSTKMIVKDWYIMCWCAKWLDSSKVISSSLPDFNYKPGSENDKEIMKELWKLLDEADIVVAHNGIKFDRKKVNTRFILNNLPPPSPYKMVDTLRVARGQFAFTSNRLDDLGQYLKVGKKVDTGGFQLWVDCLAGNRKSWDNMVEYCKQDVLLLEQVYLKLRPFMPNHPNVNLDSRADYLLCGTCGSSDLQKRGYSYTTTAKFQRYQCVDCGKWMRDANNLRSKFNSLSKTRNIT